MSDSMEEAIEAIKAMGITHDEQQIREALLQCNNNRQEAVQLLFPESPVDSMLSGDYVNIGPPYKRNNSDDSWQMKQRDGQDPHDVHMRDTETLPGSPDDSDRDSTTVSYSLDEDNLRDVDGDVETDFRNDNETEYPPLNSDPDHIRTEGLPPRYEDIVSDNQADISDMSEDTQPPPLVAPDDDKLTTPTGGDASATSSNIEFPLTHFYELESRVHTDQWSIPYKRDESLAICMVATIRMIREGAGLAEGDENCKKFMEKTMYDSFQKLVTHEAVFRWDQSIMEGIYDMCRIVMELLAERLKQPPVPLILLDLLVMVFNADANFHIKMRNKRTDPVRWKRLLGDDDVFAQMPHFQTHKDPKGWLVDIMNIFAQHGGVKAIKDVIMNTEEVTLQELTALFQPFSVCEDYINPVYLKVMLSKSILRAFRFVHDLSDESLKNKEVGCVSDLLKSLKTLLLRCNLLDMVTTIDNIRLETTIRMLNIAHFNAKMNALKEVVRLTDEPYQAAARGVRSPIPADRIADWLVENKVLSIALGGNLHQSQYCDKLKSIVEFLGPKLSMDELTTIWEMQVDKNPVQVENVHGILAAAASRSGPNHLDHIFQLIQQSWESAPDRYREKLLQLIGKIGKDDVQGKTATKILELLWSLAHLPQLSREMVELALESHSSILVDSSHTKEPEKKTYINKCVEDIRKGVWVVSAFRQLHRFAKGFFKTGYGQKDQHQIAEFQRQYELLRLTCNSLVKCHGRAVADCTQSGETLSGETLIDGRYTHSECVEIHLQFMAYLLQEGALYMPVKRAIEVWDALISAPDTCATDRTHAFKWFDSGMTDLEHETQVLMFNTRVLKVDPDKLDQPGYHCLRNFFETINLFEKKLKRLSSSYHSFIVENPELTGMDYLWRAALEVRDTKIADQLIQNILQVSYQGLGAKLKKDISVLHRRFIDECFKRLDDLLDGGKPAKTSTSKITSPTLKLQAIERLLLLAQRYITVVEESHHFPRALPPHGATFLGHPLVLSISTDHTSFKMDGHYNESLLSIKEKIAQRLNATQDQLQIGTSERWLDSGDNNKLVHQLGFTDQQLIIVKIRSMLTNSYSKAADEGNAQRQSLARDMEQNLPGVIMATQTEVFSKLEHLCSMESSKVIKAVRGLLMLIPTDHRIAEVMDVFTKTPLEGPGATEDPDTPTTPQGVLGKYFSTSCTSPTQLLYNLEVLSGRLIPAVHKADEAVTQTFRRTFLECGGLKSVINVLQKNALPSDLDLTVRQDCYAIALSLARFLLCNHGTLTPAQQIPVRQHSSISQSSASGHPDEGEDPLITDGAAAVTDGGEDKGVKRHELMKTISTDDEVARLTIETMTVDDFATTLAYLIRVCWSAAAGQLHLASIGDSEPSSPAQPQRGRPSPSPGPPASGVVMQLRAGLCGQQDAGSVGPKNAAIARESLELLVTCLKLRSPLLNIFYTLPHVSEFIIDILLGSPHPDIRSSVVNHLSQLCQLVDTDSAHPPFLATNPIKRAKTSSVEPPQHFFLHLLMKHPESLWEQPPGEQKGSVKQWERCTEYFEFRCQLLRDLRVFEQESLSIDIQRMVQKELDWLNDVQVSTSSSPAFQCLLAGHLRLTQVLFTCEGVDKKALGNGLASRLISHYMFPASKMIIESQEPTPMSINPICSELNSRVAAYKLLVELSTNCFDNLSLVARQLISMHHQPDPQISKEWEYQPPVVGRSPCGYVGLKNAGATCYMNSVLQQLYMTQTIREAILGVETDQDQGEVEKETILPELQCVFGHMLESRLQYYVPEDFWKKFKLWGEPVNVREQQDAFDFFCNLTDQVDEQLKKNSSPPVIQEAFGGKFLDQKICRGCEHTYEREESFLSLSLPVKSKKSLEESLKEFVKGDLLEGDNAYFCEKCEEKRDTLKRTCIKTLPPVLMVHLKRFGYDWEANRAIKYDDFFEFPWMLDMAPYTFEGITQLDEGNEITKHDQYELVGIVVHSGQASAGHYYAFIKESSYQSVAPGAEGGAPVETRSGRWLRFNDIIVDEFVMSDSALEAECFGGSYKPKSTDAHHNQPETRVRFWNAYMLFYESVDESKRHVHLPRHRKLSELPSPISPATGVDKLQQLQALVQKGEKRHIFSEIMPAVIQRGVNEENLQFMQHRDVYSPEYFDFVLTLVVSNMALVQYPQKQEHIEFGLCSLQLGINFLFHTYFKTKKKLRIDLEKWVRNVELIIRQNKEACSWLMDVLSGANGGSYLKPFLLECPNREVRLSFCQILSQTVQSYISFGSPTSEGPVKHLVDTLLKMLEKDVIDNSKACAEYFEFFRSYASYPQGCRHLLEEDTFVMLVNFLLGPVPKEVETRQDKTPPRRWSSNQVKEFGPLHGAVSLLVRNTDISMFESETESADMSLMNPYMLPSQRGDLQPPSDGMHQALFTIDHSKRFIKECVLTLRENDMVTAEAIGSTFCYCCWNNQSFSACALEDLQVQISSVHSSELRAYFKVLTELLLIGDSLQSKRISFTISGGKYQPHVSVFSTIRNNSSVQTQSDSKKAYQGIKFLVGLANKCTQARDFLLSHSSEWQWAVTWLRRKMTDSYSWSHSGSVSNESSSNRLFQRTISAQDTLEEANAILLELEARDSKQAPQVTVSNENEGDNSKNGPREDGTTRGSTSSYGNNNTEPGNSNNDQSIENQIEG